MTVSVSPAEPAGEWLLRVRGPGGEAGARAIRLAECGGPGDGTELAEIECRISTAGYGSGKHVVDVSPDAGFAPERMTTRSVAVEAAGERPAGALTRGT